jgi:hypothetical protein
MIYLKRRAMRPRLRSIFSMTTQSAESISSILAVPIGPAGLVPQEVLETAARLGVLKHMPEVVAVTRELFGTISRVRVLDDPEFADDTHIILHVPANGTVEQDLEREKDWGRRLRQIIPRSPQVYLVFVDY